MSRRVRLPSRTAVSNLLYPIAFAALFLALWELATHVFSIEPYILPPPSAILRTLVSDWALLQANLTPTFIEVVVGFALAAILGVSLAVALVAVPILAKSIYPILVSSQVVPKIAIAPLFLVWFGFGTTPKILIVLLMAFFPIVVGMTLGLSTVSKELLFLVRSMGASRWKAFWKVRFMHALPHLFAGLKVGITLAVVGAVVGEFVGSDEGLGWVILGANSNLNTDLVFAAIFVLTGLGVALYAGIEAIERVVRRG